ncbi:probable NADH dehydrogenase [ubiquinone] 1 alpha subcomplex subunit 5, mitochondrial isoform X2 [Actinidia eriantha]|uniref:probable NADH dehydrogenase [ubiquinone] 1 alpha subcomplex subunit 5, mitochondrial isoform X2 n=1 Tax=Actinidia eriantha TaxID=165200 RepID=UPI0025858D44|nr:probable NADH dehydrogenase [ubiquinone] 1 alpha subcomplex subunit 5, mitochondrial isoform X2 [Actinidia eriantha]
MKGVAVYFLFSEELRKQPNRFRERERESREKMFLRMASRPLMARVKETTGIVGLEVVPNAREVLISLYNKTLKEIQTVPEDEGYRKAVESFTRHRLNVCQEEHDWEAIEKRLGCGQVEELIEEAKDELKLIGKMIGGIWNSTVDCLELQNLHFVLLVLESDLRRGSKILRLYQVGPMGCSR